MEILTKKNCVYIGFFQKTYKYSGSLLLIFEPKWELSLSNVKILITEIDGLPVPWFVHEDGISVTGPNTALITLKWINDEKAAKKICGKSVYIENRHIHVTDNKIYTPGWINYYLEEQTRGYIGKITGEENYSGNLVLSVEIKSGTLLIPFHSDFVIKTNHLMKTLTLKLPDGLI